MRASFSQSFLAGLAALALSGSICLTAEPAEAQWRMGGWHGGGWGGGWRGGGWGGWRGGWGWRGPCGGWGCGAWAPGLAVAAWGVPAWGWGWGPGWGWDSGWGWGPGVTYANDSGCWVVRRVWTRGGRYLGRRLVNVCM
jgi:hypothetical protein